MNKSKLKKYVNKNVTVHYRHRNRPAESGKVIYRPDEPLSDYFLYQSQYGTPVFYVALEPKMIGHIEIDKN